MFDVVVITAANAAQARGYREQVKWRRAQGLLPAWWCRIPAAAAWEVSARR